VELGLPFSFTKIDGRRQTNRIGHRITKALERVNENDYQAMWHYVSAISHVSLMYNSAATPEKPEAPKMQLPFHAGGFNRWLLSRHAASTIYDQT
jgi:hypothetical protein